VSVDLSWLVGRRCDAVHRDEFSWSFVFDAGAVTTPSLWRLIESGRIRVTSEDHGHQFGLPAPLDARHDAESALRSRAIESAKIRANTGDLILEFAGDLVLELLQTSSGYEAWHLISPDGQSIVATGGGELAIWNG
jgi:uncharacterized protein DUF6188